MKQSFSVSALTEDDVTGIMFRAGGKLAHEEADKRKKRGADYVLGSAAVELKMLDEDALFKPTHQAKLSRMFSALWQDQPVLVLDREALSPQQQHEYDRIVERPIQGHVRSARKQLPETRAEYPETENSVLFVCNNGYTSLDHDTLKELVARRVRQDTSRIDGVVVAGCYYHSDGFDNVFLFPIDYLPIQLSSSFSEFETLRDSWSEFANEFMSEVMRGDAKAGRKLLPPRDIVFDYEGKRFVKPAPVFGPSEFYIHGRAREDTSGIQKCPPVGLIVPGLTRSDWGKIVDAIEDPPECLATFQNWQAHIEAAGKAATKLKPLVRIHIDADAWLKWCHKGGASPELRSLNSFALQRYEAQVLQILNSSREIGPIQPSVFVRVSTQEIGQDKANDVSSIALVRHTMTETTTREILAPERMLHEHALALGASYALSENSNILLWEKDTQYSWR